MKKNKKEYFPITSLHRDDIKQVAIESMDPIFQSTIERIIDNITDEQMQTFADELGEAYMDLGYWEVIEEITISYIKNKLSEMEPRLMEKNNNESTSDRDS